MFVGQRLFFMLCLTGPTLQAQPEAARPVRLHNLEAATGTRTQPLYGHNATGLSLSGSEFVAGKLGLWDGGDVLAAHRELTGRVQLRNATGRVNDHATHLAGTLVARGLDPKARGMAYGASLQVWDYTNDLTELTTAAPGLLLSVHAYGPRSGWVLNLDRPGADLDQKWEWWGNTAVSNTEDYLFGFYNAAARSIDRIAYQNPAYLMVRSADNKRAETGPPPNTPYYLNNSNQQSTLPRSRNNAYDVIPGEATAKNALTVGSAEVTLDSGNQLVSLTSAPYSGWGPTDDGRIKPDLLGIGTNVYSTLSTNTLAYGPNTGTSMAAANVAGSLLLLQELNARQTNGRFLRAATLRGLAIHTADRLTPANGPDYRQGWGLLNTEAAATVLRNPNQAHVLVEQRLIGGQSWTLSVIAQGGEPLVVTLCWTDPEGIVEAVTSAALNHRTLKLINDLDLRVTGSGQTSQPFVLNPDQPAATATQADNVRDNVEQVYIANPVAGQTYTIRISHKSGLQTGAQDFSVLVSGRKHSPCSLPARPLLTVRDTTLCAGSSVPLRVDDLPGLTYEWLRDDHALAQTNAPIYAASATGAYRVRYTDRNGCVGMSTPVRVTMLAPIVQLTPADVLYICPEQLPARLVAIVDAGAGITVNWLRNGQVLTSATSQTLVPTQPGAYRVQLTQQGCRTFSQEVIVRSATLGEVRILPADDDIPLPRGATVRLQGPEGDRLQYAWYRDNQPLPLATDRRLFVGEPGTYRLRVMQQQCTSWSDIKLVHWASDKRPNTLPDSLLSAGQIDSTLVAYPNPARQTLHVRYVRPGAAQVAAVVFDMQGNQVGPELVMLFNQGLFGLDLPVFSLMQGQYVLRLTDGDRSKTLRFLRE